ncbi:hypothetical protein AKJ16_DCAP12149 [Drosera capensis]
MEDPSLNKIDSLFEGMVLFTPSQIAENDDSNADLGPVPPIKDDEPTAPLPSSSSEPLDDNLFSDLTIIAPLEAEEAVQSVSLNPIPVAVTKKTSGREAASGASVSRQISRKKKRVSVRIGYGRDVQSSEDHPSRSYSSDSLSLDESSLAIAESSVQPDLKGEEEGKQDSDLLSSVSTSDSRGKSHSNPLSDVTKGTANSSIGITDSVDEHKNADDDEKSTQEENDFSEIPIVKEETGTSTMAGVKEEKSTQEQERSEDKEAAESFEVKYERIKTEISDKLRHAKKSAASISLARKESRRRRRKAFESIDLASVRYKELEKRLDEACEAEDFEMADSLSESLAAAEKEKEDLLKDLRDADADCDAIDSKMQEAVEYQIKVEEECISLLQRFSEDAAINADSILRNVESNASREMDDWFSSAESLEVKKMELEIQSQLVDEARVGLDSSINYLVEDETREKEVLCKRKETLAEELDRLLALVRQKEAEIAENDSKIEAVDKRIAEVVSDFEEMRSGIVTKFEGLQSSLSEIQLQNEALSNKQKGIERFLLEEKERGAALAKLAAASNDIASTYEENLVMRKDLVLSILKSREEKLRLSRAEEEILSSIQVLKLQVSASRSSLQELSLKQSNIQQEIEASKQRILFIDKRIPELEADKRVAASVRNFKEAARVAAEAKALSTDRESEQAKMVEVDIELKRLDEEIKGIEDKVEETEGTVLFKEKEAAVAKFQRLNLVASAALAEHSAALELDDPEEAQVLLAEAEAAQSEARELRSVYGIDAQDLEDSHTSFISMELVSSLDGSRLAELANKASVADGS